MNWEYSEAQFLGRFGIILFREIFDVRCKITMTIRRLPTHYAFFGTPEHIGSRFSHATGFFRFGEFTTICGGAGPYPSIRGQERRPVSPFPWPSLNQFTSESSSYIPAG